jgi:hypothetical protein
MKKWLIGLLSALLIFTGTGTSFALDWLIVKTPDTGMVVISGMAAPASVDCYNLPDYDPENPGAWISDFVNDCSQQFSAGETPELLAVPSPGYEFTGWSDEAHLPERPGITNLGAPAGQEMDNPLVFTFDYNRGIMPTFALIPDPAPVDIIGEASVNTFAWMNTESTGIFVANADIIASIADIPEYEVGEVLEVEFQLTFPGKGINGGDLIITGVFDAQATTYKFLQGPYIP